MCLEYTRKKVRVLHFWNNQIGAWTEILGRNLSPSA